MMGVPAVPSDLPRDNLFRSASAFELRAASGEAMPTMVVNFARFDEWTEINSLWEGRFLERFTHGAFTKTFREQAATIRAIFQHGQDPVAGLKPLGTVTDLREQDDGAWGEVDLFDTDYVRQLVPGIQAGVFGASFAFQVVRSEDVMDPERSERNPNGVPERTVREARLREFGPVTWGAYPNASTGARSLTDEVAGRRDVQRLRDLIDRIDASKSSIVADERAPDCVSTPALTAARLALMARRHPVSIA